MKIIVDCDNAMGVPGCDIVDGLSLLYLMGKKNMEICGITTTYGNSKIDTVYHNTKKMLAEIGRRDIPVLRGCANRYSLESEAADYLVERVSADPGEISILATGALTNLYAAYIKDHNFFDKIRQIIVMGGITNDLVLYGKEYDEWNFMVDPSATHWVLREGKNLTLITRNNCIDVQISISDFIHRLISKRSPMGRYIVDRCTSWLEYNMLQLKSDSFYLWDLLAASYVVNPQFYKDQQQLISLDMKNISKGFLRCTDDVQKGRMMNLPVLCDSEALKEDLYQTWLGVEENFEQQVKGGL